MRSVRVSPFSPSVGALAAFLLLCSAVCTQAAQPGRLSGATIQELISGATVHMHTPVGTVIPVKYAEDGTVSGKTSGMVAYYLGASSDQGRWWIKGRRLCQKWTTWFSGKTKCIEIRRQGRKFHWKDREGETGTATLVASPAQTIARKERTRKPLEKPYSLGIATEEVSSLVPASRSVSTQSSLRQPLSKPARRIRKKTVRRAPARQAGAMRVPPPLPVRPVQRQAYVKTSSWTMRAQ